MERVPEGVSTEVYRIRNHDDVFYLRILPEEGAGFIPEAAVHRLLRERGVLVPDVVYVAHYHPLVQRSVMLTTAIDGQAVGYGACFDRLQEVIVRAGQALAAINSIEVDGFGWIQRNTSATAHLRAEFRSQRAWLADELDGVLAVLYDGAVLNAGQTNMIERLFVRYAALLDDERAYLAHGDFDVTHLYHRHGHFTGIIDFGEIRGASRLYDIGHFAIEHNALLPWLLEGYRQVISLPDDHAAYWTRDSERVEEHISPRPPCNSPRN
jgi:aminoglycoside phosphotransferase (APT) family kinase protein